MFLVVHTVADYLVLGTCVLDLDRMGTHNPATDERGHA